MLGQLLNTPSMETGAEGVCDVDDASAPASAAALVLGDAGPGLGVGALRSTMGSKPVLPVSRPRRAFCRDSWKVRPMAITSPTDFIWVVRRSLAPETSRSAKRGIW